jgi:hypothetical protein
MFDGDWMSEKKKPKDLSDVDRGLVAMFLNMSIEERLRANDNAVRTILELRYAYKKQKTIRTGFKRSA